MGENIQIDERPEKNQEIMKSQLDAIVIYINGQRLRRPPSQHPDLRR